MSSEKPFWEGKTCEEMAGLHIKVTFKNGDVATGVADKNGDIKSVYVLTLGMGDDLFVPQADPLIILKADNHQGSDRWDVYVSKTVYPTAESYGTLAGVLRMLADDVEIMAREKEMGGGQ